jgi:hypothetical protein
MQQLTHLNVTDSFLRYHRDGPPAAAYAALTASSKLQYLNLYMQSASGCVGSHIPSWPAAATVAGIVHCLCAPWFIPRRSPRRQPHSQLLPWSEVTGHAPVAGHSQAAGSTERAKRAALCAHVHWAIGRYLCMPQRLGALCDQKCWWLRLVVGLLPRQG